jgi:hypothetical protein
MKSEKDIRRLLDYLGKINDHNFSNTTDVYKMAYTSVFEDEDAQLEVSGSHAADAIMANLTMAILH